MANRSDFLGHLPRSHKKPILMGKALGFVSGPHHAAVIRAAFKDAHRNYKNFRLNRKLPAEVKAALKADAEAEAKGEAA